MKPDVLILDEPTAGLDPAGRDEILGLVSKMHRELGITILLVSHSMEDIARHVQQSIIKTRMLVYLIQRQEKCQSIREMHMVRCILLM